MRVNPAALLVFVAMMLALLLVFSRPSGAIRAVEEVAVFATLVVIGGVTWRSG